VKRFLLVISCLFLIGIPITGCGSDDSEPITKAEFKQQASAICAKGEKERIAAIEASGKQTGGSVDAENERIKVLIRDELVPIVQRTYDEISELGAPEGDEKAVAQFVASFEKGAQELERDPTRAYEENVFVPANSVAEEYGLTACSI
jgi:hypothetical protein